MIVTGARATITDKEIITASKDIDEQGAFTVSGISIRMADSENWKGRT